MDCTANLLSVRILTAKRNNIQRYHQIYSLINHTANLLSVRILTAKRNNIHTVISSVEKSYEIILWIYCQYVYLQPKETTYTQWYHQLKSLTRSYCEFTVSTYTYSQKKQHTHSDIISWKVSLDHTANLLSVRILKAKRNNIQRYHQIYSLIDCTVNLLSVRILTAKRNNIQRYHQIYSLIDCTVNLLSVYILTAKRNNIQRYH